MDMAYFFGGFFVYVAPPLISIISRKVKGKPSIKNPIWQYAITFVIMTIILLLSTHSYAAQMLLPALLVYGVCFFVDLSMYRHNRIN